MINNNLPVDKTQKKNIYKYIFHCDTPLTHVHIITFF